MESVPVLNDAFTAENVARAEEARSSKMIPELNQYTRGEII
jgi:hypothetical protein